jgi:hypothetical protein
MTYKLFFFATLLVAALSADDYYTTKDDYINGMIDRHLKKKMGPNEGLYR